MSYRTSRVSSRYARWLARYFQGAVPRYRRQGRSRMRQRQLIAQKPATIFSTSLTREHSTSIDFPEESGLERLTAPAGRAAFAPTALVTFLYLSSTFRVAFTSTRTGVAPRSPTWASSTIGQTAAL